jgi:hypothetical protein
MMRDRVEFLRTPAPVQGLRTRRLGVGIVNPYTVQRLLEQVIFAIGHGTAF